MSRILSRQAGHQKMMQAVNVLADLKGRQICVRLRDGRVLRGAFENYAIGPAELPDPSGWFYRAHFVLQTGDGEFEIDYLDVKTATAV